MNTIPFSTSSPTGWILAAVFGLIFGVLLQKGGVTNYNVIVNLFRFRDWTVLRIMLTAILVGGIGVFSMMQFGWLEGYHIKDLNLPGLLMGGCLFGIGMVLYGYCPGTGVAAIATGSVHALVGFGGMLFGGIAYALSYGALKESLFTHGAFGKVRLTETLPLPEWTLWIVLVGISLLVFRLLRGPKQQEEAS